MLENQQQCSASTGRLLGLLRAPHARQVTSLVCEDVEGTEGCWGQGRLQSVRSQTLDTSCFCHCFRCGRQLSLQNHSTKLTCFLLHVPIPPPNGLSPGSWPPSLSLLSHRMVVTHVKDEAGPRGEPGPLGAINVARPICSLRETHPLFQGRYIHALIEHLLCTSSCTMC